MTNIQPGDRAEVIKWPCCGKFLWRKLLVTRLEQPPVGLIGIYVCDCGVRHFNGHFILAIDETLPKKIPNLLVCAPVEWLRKLPPLTEPETIETTEEVTA